MLQKLNYEEVDVGVSLCVTAEPSEFVQLDVDVSPQVTAEPSAFVEVGRNHDGKPPCHLEMLFWIQNGSGSAGRSGLV